MPKKPSKKTSTKKAGSKRAPRTKKEQGTVERQEAIIHCHGGQLSKIDYKKLTPMSGFRYVVGATDGFSIHFETPAAASKAYQAMVADGAGGVDDFMPDDTRFLDDGSLSGLVSSSLGG